MPRVKASVSHEREMLVLSCVGSHLDGAEGAVISIVGLAQETGLTAYQARSALQRLARGGMVDVCARSHPNGASAENAYRLTKIGSDALTRSKSLVVSGEPAGEQCPQGFAH